MLRDYQKKIIIDVFRSWYKGHKRPCIVAPCGSGKTVMAAELAKQFTNRPEHVMFITHRAEICEQTRKIFRRYGVNMEYCKVGMVQTLTKRKFATPSLIVMDENHHVYAESYLAILERHPSAKVVGLTATPVRLEEGGLGKINDALIMSPSVSELIDKGHLAPFRYISVDSEQISVFEDAKVKPIFGSAVTHYRNYGLDKTIVYCNNINNSQATAKEFCSAGIPAMHVDGNTPKKQRSAIMGKFRAGKVKVLCNVDLVSEGFDVPDCDSVILMRPTMSLTLHIQQSMRCMRPKPGKVATIIDMVGNYKKHKFPDTQHDWSLVYYTDEKETAETGDGHSGRGRKPLIHVDAELEEVRSYIPRKRKTGFGIFE